MEGKKIMVSSIIDFNHISLTLTTSLPNSQATKFTRPMTMSFSTFVSPVLEQCLPHSKCSKELTFWEIYLQREHSVKKKKKDWGYTSSEIGVSGDKMEKGVIRKVSFGGLGEEEGGQRKPATKIQSRREGKRGLHRGQLLSRRTVRHKVEWSDLKLEFWAHIVFTLKQLKTLLSCLMLDYMFCLGLSQQCAGFS